MITRKIFGYGLIAVMLTLALVACESPTDPAHVHDYEWSVTTPATCIATGEETGVCKLDPSHTTTRVIAIDLVNGHDWDFDNATETVVPTCTTKGSGTANCKRNGCNETNTGTDNIPALGHDYQNYTETTAPTCTTAGIETGTCTRDQVTTTRTGNPALGHDYQNYTETTAPTCTTAGIETGTCTRDQVTTTRTGAVALGHDWNTETGLCDNDCGELYYELGDTGPGGGKIFFRSVTAFATGTGGINTAAHYLEAAPADMPTRLAWASITFIPPDHGGTGDWVDITGTSTGTGTGKMNTARILATDANAPAAKACNDYSNGGKTDWFLPSWGDLTHLYENRTSVGNMGTDWYWSSSQGGKDYAWLQFFNNGSQGNLTKDSIGLVRAVRSF